MEKGIEHLATELLGAAALLNAFSLQYSADHDRLSDGECENALNTVQRLLQRIADDMYNIDIVKEGKA